MRFRRRVTYDLISYAKTPDEKMFWYDAREKKWGLKEELTTPTGWHSHHRTRRSADRSIRKLIEAHKRHNATGEYVLCKFFRRGGRKRMGEYFPRTDRGNYA